MQMSGILRYAISRKRPTVNTQQENEDVFYLDTTGKPSSETVNDIQPTTSPRIHSLPFPTPGRRPEVQKREELSTRDLFAARVNYIGHRY